jgi:hypothetical protein
LKTVQPEPKDDKATAQTILGEYLDRCRQRPPKNVVGQMAKQIKGLLEDDFDPDTIRRGIAQWMTRDVHPSVLPSIVNSLVNSTAAASTGTDGVAGHGPRANVTDVDWSKGFKL